jgi:hypothetical protein
MARGHRKPNAESRGFQIMSSKYWLLFGSLALGAAHTAACSREFRTCEQTRTCATGGAAGKGTAEAGEGGEAGAQERGTGGLDLQGGKAGSGEAGVGEAGSADSAGSNGTAGDSSIEQGLEIAQPTLAAGKTYVPFTGKISASGATHYDWSIASGTLPAGLSLQGAQSATVTIAGAPTEAGQFPISLNVTDGTTTKTVDVTLVVTHSALFLSDRNVSGVNELFLTEIGAESASAPVRLNASIPSGGGVSSYAWSPDGSKVLYLATQSSGGAAELWVASLAAPGSAQRVSAAGLTVSQMAWLKMGNIAGYSTTAGDTFLVDLSAASVGQSKFVLAGHGSPSYLYASPNGTSLSVSVINDSINMAEISYATWGSATPTVVPLLTVQGGVGGFSYDGRYVIVNTGPSAQWFDLSLATPMSNLISSGNGVGVSWSPNTESLFMVRGGGASFEFSRADFSSAGLTISALATPNDCGATQVRWAPDGKNGLYVCAADVRGISNLATAAAGADFSLLPSGFLSNTFTDTPTIGWSPDSKWVALRADRDVNAQYDLQLIRWSAPGVAYKPHANSIGSGVASWAFAQNSQSVAFVGNIAPQNNAGLYLSKLPSTGAPPTAALVSAPANAVVQSDINWLPGSRVIAYRATVSGATQLFAVPIAPDGNAGGVVSISGVSGSGVSAYQLAPTR